MIYGWRLPRSVCQLSNDSLRQGALLRMEGYTNEEVADRLGRSLRSIARKVNLIRRIWIGEEASE
jgi:hypothetical protein